MLRLKTFSGIPGLHEESVLSACREQDPAVLTVVEPGTAGYSNAPGYGSHYETGRAMKKTLKEKKHSCLTNRRTGS